MRAIVNIKVNILILSFCFATLSACSSAPSKTQAPVDKQQADKTLAQQMSDFEDVTIQTSNGELEVSPTVVAPTQATVSSNGDVDILYYDPIEGFNRAVFTFNHYSYKYALIPLATGYEYVVPQPLRKGVTNAFDNLREPLNLVNNVITGEGKQAGRNLGRFLINSTVGILGLFDPADHWFDIPQASKNFSDALSDYDVGKGAYIVLPLLGQADARATVSVVAEGLVHPANFIAPNPEATYIRAGEGFDDFSKQAELYMELYKQAEDPYIYFRNQYLQSQHRDELFKAVSDESSANSTGHTTGSKNGLDDDSQTKEVDNNESAKEE